MHCILFYDVVENFVEKRAALRSAHLAHVREAFERGELVLAGALAEPTDGAVVVFRGTSPEPAERFARADPYVLNGLVTNWTVKPWRTVVGQMAADPTRPG